GLAKQENHLLGAVVERILRERTVFRHGLQAGQQEQRPQMRISEVGQPESLSLLQDQLAGANGAVNEGEVEDLMDFVDRILSEVTAHDFRGIRTRTPLELQHFLTHLHGDQVKLRIEDVERKNSI